jgi:hypothetical protein
MVSQTNVNKIKKPNFEELEEYEIQSRKRRKLSNGHSQESPSQKSKAVNSPSSSQDNVLGTLSNADSYDEYRPGRYE